MKLKKMVIVATVIALLGQQLYGPVALALGFTEEHLSYDGGGAETYSTVLILLCIVAFCFYPWFSLCYSFFLASCSITAHSRSALSGTAMASCAFRMAL